MKNLKYIQLFEAFSKKEINKSIVTKKLKDKDDDKILSQIFVIKKGLYKWNNVYGVYNSIKNNDQLMKDDIKNIDWSKSREYSIK